MEAQDTAETKQFRRGLAPDEGGKDGFGLVEASLDSIQIEKAGRSAEATTSTMGRMVATTILCEEREHVARTQEKGTSTTGEESTQSADGHAPQGECQEKTSADKVVHQRSSY